jgi:hypothetical protein
MSPRRRAFAVLSCDLVMCPAGGRRLGLGTSPSEAARASQRKVLVPTGADATGGAGHGRPLAVWTGCGKRQSRFRVLGQLG